MPGNFFTNRNNTLMKNPTLDQLIIATGLLLIFLIAVDWIIPT